jgi:hypothetical protein
MRSSLLQLNKWELWLKLEGVNPINSLKSKAEGMKKFKDRITDEVLKEIFPKKLRRSQSLDEVYTYVLP